MNSPPSTPQAVDVRLRSPFTSVVAGPTGLGKTQLVFRLIKQARWLANPPPVEIIYCYRSYQRVLDDVQGVCFQEGMIDVKADIPDDGQNRWLIVEYLMEELSSKGQTNNLFTQHSHHKNVSVFLIVQNLFKKELHTVTVNSHYFFLAKNPRDASTMTNLAKQAFPGESRYVAEAFADATSKPYSFCLINVTQRTGNKRIVGNFASKAKPMVVYSPK